MAAASAASSTEGHLGALGREPDGGTRALLSAIRQALAPPGERTAPAMTGPLAEQLVALADLAEARRVGLHSARRASFEDAAAASSDTPPSVPSTEEAARLRTELADLKNAAFAAAEGQAMAAARRAAVADAELEALRADLAAAKARSDQLDWRLKAAQSESAMQAAAGAATARGGVVMGVGKAAARTLLGLAAACTAPRAAKSIQQPAPTSGSL